jgi:chemotaxis response regulator CheB
MELSMVSRDLVRVVVVDDDDGIRQLLEVAMEFNPHYELVGTASNGQEAISVVEYSRPDLVLLDVMMPVMDGIDALPRIKMVSPATLVVFLSALSTWQLDAYAKGREVSNDVHPDAVIHKSAIPFGLFRDLNQFFR